jgi:hypothetical protein
VVWCVVDWWLPLAPKIGKMDQGRLGRIAPVLI